MPGVLYGMPDLLISQPVHHLFAHLLYNFESWLRQLLNGMLHLQQPYCLHSL